MRAAAERLSLNLHGIKMEIGATVYDIARAIVVNFCSFTNRSRFLQVYLEEPERIPFYSGKLSFSPC